MARTKENAKLNSRDARIKAKLKPRSEPYWHSLEKGLAVGYYKGTNGGTWVARHFTTETGRRKKPLGIADDHTDPNGLDVLSFDQAQQKARDWRDSLLANDRGESSTPGKYTVADAVEDYMKDREREKRKKLPRTRSVVKTHILPKIGAVKLDELRHSKLKEWRDSLADSMPQVRRNPNAAQVAAYRSVDLKDEETSRKRQATANRIYTVLRAALNYAYKHGKVSDDSAWKRIAPFKQVDAAKVRYLSVNECLSLIEVCPADFQALVRAALYTGCRYGELIAMQACAFNADANTIHIQRSKSGKQRYIPLTDEGAAFFHGIVQNRRDTDAMFIHREGPCEGEAWDESQQRYWIESACEKAKIKPAIGFHILRHTYASQLAMNGTPMPVIASLLGHADTRMTEKHYSHLSPSYVANTLRANLPNFGFMPVTAPGPQLVAKAG